MQITSPQLDLALSLLHVGIACIPIRTEKGREKTPALSKWKQFEQRLPTEAELRQAFSGRSFGIAAICGAVSMGLECLDFEVAHEFGLFADELDQLQPDLLRRLVQVKTPSGGFHLWYRCPEECGPSTRLAMRDSTPEELEANPKDKIQLLIETRGEGGYALLPGGDPLAHQTGEPYEYVYGHITKVPVLSADERHLMLDLARSFNRVARPAKGSTPIRPKAALGTMSAIDDFDNRGSWQEILEPHGWTLSSGDWEFGRLTRPGKDRGVSATVGYCRSSAGDSLLHVFTTGSSMEPGTYGKFRALGILNYAGNFSETVKALGQQGYGTPVTPRAQGSVGPQAQLQATTQAQNKEQKPDEPTKLPWEIPPQKGERPRKIVNAVDLMRKEFVPVPYTVDGILSQGLNLIGGKPKAGKSWFALQLAWAVAGGYEMSGRKVRSGSVLYLALEDTEPRLQSRMKLLRTATGWDFPCKLDIATVWPRCDDSGLYYICEWLEARKNDAVLVIVDTLQKFRKPIKGQTNNYADDYEALEGLKGLCDLYGVTALVMHHTRKLKAEDPFEELSGTQGLAGAADGLGVLDRDRSNATGRLYITGRDQGDSTTPLIFSGDSGLWTLGETTEGIDTEGRAVQPDKGPNKVEQCIMWMREFLREFAYPSAEFKAAAQAAGFGWGTIKEAQSATGEQGSKEFKAHNFGSRAENDWWIGKYYAPGTRPHNWIRRPPSTSSNATATRGNSDEQQKTDDWVPDEM
jgi:hypothetical protein